MKIQYLLMKELLNKKYVEEGMKPFFFFVDLCIIIFIEEERETKGDVKNVSYRKFNSSKRRTYDTS